MVSHHRLLFSKIKFLVFSLVFSIFWLLLFQLRFRQLSISINLNYIKWLVLLFCSPNSFIVVSSFSRCAKTIVQIIFVCEYLQVWWEWFAVWLHKCVCASINFRLQTIILTIKRNLYHNTLVLNTIVWKLFIGSLAGTTDFRNIECYRAIFVGVCAGVEKTTCDIQSKWDWIHWLIQQNTKRLIKYKYTMCACNPIQCILIGLALEFILYGYLIRIMFVSIFCCYFYLIRLNEHKQVKLIEIEGRFSVHSS